MAARMRAAMTPDMPATPDSDSADLKGELQGELRSFRAGLKTRDLVLATAVLGVVTVGCLVKALTGWPHIRIIGGEEQIYGFLGLFGSSFGGMLIYTLRVCLGDDDLDDDGGNNSLGGARGSW